MMPASRMCGSQRAFWSGVPWASSVGPDEVHADPSDELGRPGSGQLLGDHVVLDRPAATPAELLRPGDADPPSARELGLPLPTERHLLGEVVEVRRQADAVLPRQVLAQPGPALAAQRFLGGGGGEVHAGAERTQPSFRSGSRLHGNPGDDQNGGLGVSGR